jgi:hypothetical protein
MMESLLWEFLAKYRTTEYMQKANFFHGLKQLLNTQKRHGHRRTTAGYKRGRIRE